MNKKVLIVEDNFVEANDLQIMLKKAGYEVCGIARSFDAAREIMNKEKPDIVLLDIFLKGKFTGIDLAKQLKEENIAFIYLSANSNEEILAEAKTTEPYGFIVKPFRERDLLVTLEIAQYRHEHSRETKYARETALLQQLEKIVNNLTPTWKEQLLQTVKTIQKEIPFDFVAIGFDAAEKIKTSAISFLRVGFNEYQTIALPELSTITGMQEDVLIKNVSNAPPQINVGYFNEDAFENIQQNPSLEKIAAETFNMLSLLYYPLHSGNGRISSLRFFSRRADSYSTEHIALLSRLQSSLLKIAGQIPGNDFTTIHTKQSVTGTQPLTNNTQGFAGIIGNSHLLLNVFDLITQVAPFDTAVLILGESGTGKEKIADCIHNLSPRKQKKLVKVNCAALPATLIESELFGHEKGSFTGATDKRIGKFEQANNGTIFLDEIGEMPVDLQVKLLRVLQEKEIEPIGSKRTIKINVRIIAATNRNLEKEVAEGRFRLDLYYRLNVFPIILPPLRERTADIPALVEHFINVYNAKAGKTITGVSSEVLQKLTDYNWPGNIRELENLVERSVLLTRGKIIDNIALPVTVAANGNVPDNRIKTMHENERDHIIRVLKQCNGKIWGAGGAAEILNLPPTTLTSKMKKLGIEKENYNQ